MSSDKPEFVLGRKVWILPILLVIGLVLAAWQPVELDTLLELGESIGSSWWFLVIVMVLVAVLFTFGLPGSLGLWVIAPFNPPWLSTILLVSASTAGAFGAYWFAGRLRSDRRPAGASGRIVKVLEESGSVLTLIAMRMLPGFPHSVINFAAGVLRWPLPGFLIATVAGLTVKWAVYASAIHGVTDAVEAGDAVSVNTLLPLVVLVGLVLAGAWARQQLIRKST